MSNIKMKKIMKKEYIKPFAKVKVVEMVIMDGASITLDPSGEGDYPSAGSKEYFDFFE